MPKVADGHGNSRNPGENEKMKELEVVVHIISSLGLHEDAKDKEKGAGWRD